MNKINSILKNVLSKVKPSKEEFEEANKLIRNFVNNLDKKIKELKIDAEIFVGGSFAKRTVINFSLDGSSENVHIGFEYSNGQVELTKAELFDSAGFLIPIFASPGKLKWPVLFN